MLTLGIQAVEKVVHQHLNSLHMTNLEPGNPHYFFLAAMVFPRRPLEMSASISLNERSMMIRKGRKTEINIRGTGVLTSNLQSPVMPQTSVRPDLLKPLEIGSHLLVDDVR